MKNLLTNWDAARIIRLVLGLGIGIFAVAKAEYIFLAFAIWIFLQGLFNLSCCGTGCNTPSEKHEKHDLFKDQIKKYKP
jgi:hypothetical protein